MTSVVAGRVAGGAALAVLAAGLLAGCGTGSDGGTTPAAEQVPPVVRVPEVPSPVATTTPSAAASSHQNDPVPRSAQTLGALLRAASGGDGDSWRDTDGREYRLGLVNAPETGECYGAEAAQRRKELTSNGFRAQVYETDRYDRSVSVVTTSDGLRLNVYLARYGFANDRFLDEFRGENPALAAELDEAFAAAKSERRGLWSACATSSDVPLVAPVAPPAPAVAPAAESAGDCHPDYLTCVPVKGDGSGRGEVNDLDCGGIGFRVQLSQIGVDPYRLDRDGNGFGCEG